MKYLIVEDFSGQPVPFIFPRRVAHSDMRNQLPYGRVISCGYVEMDDGNIQCAGGDADLGCSAREAEDARIIADALRKS